MSQEDRLAELHGYISGLLDEFRAQPGRFLALISDMEPAARRRPLAPGEWSAHQVVAHVVATDEEALLPRLRRIQEEERPQLPNWDEELWMERDYDPEADLSELLARWQRARQEQAQALEGAESTVWNRAGIHPVQRERTLLWWLEYAAAHAKEHLEQLGARASRGALSGGHHG